MAVAKRYAQRAARDDGRLFGLDMRRAAARFLEDLKRARSKDCAFKFDGWHARDACGFIESLPHVEGQWDEPDIVLHPAHVFFLVNLFGFRSRSSGARRFSSALFAVARKNAKSTLAAGILLYCECCENEPGAQVISAATTFPQAAIIYQIAKRMVEKTPDLRARFGLTLFSKSIARERTGASFKPIHAKASTQDGLNPSHTALDEIHAHKSADLLNVLTSAAGARQNPLWLYTTTEGYASPGPWQEIRTFARQVLAGAVVADHFLIVFFAIDKDDAEFDEAVWRKANPLMDVNPHLLSAIRKEAIEARAMPSKMAEFRIKRLNRPSSVADGWINLERWRACETPVDLEFLRGKPCTAGLDLASTTDFCSWRLVWRVGEVWYTWGRRWVPEEAVAKRSERGMVPYAGWVESGHLTLTEGSVTDYRQVERDILQDFERFGPSLVGYDPWNSTAIVQNLTTAGLVLQEVRQGPQSYHPAMKELEAAYISGNFAHGNDPVLNWCAANIVVRRDQNMNMAPDKKKSGDKIDDMAALLMAIAVSLKAVEEQPKYQMLFL